MIEECSEKRCPGPILVTGAAGFIGFHTALQLIRRGYEVVGVDNLNTYYDVRLKEARLEHLKHVPEGDRFHFVRLDLAQHVQVFELFDKYKFSNVIHLAAQAGVRYSLEHPLEYIDANMTALVNVLEGCRHVQSRHLVFGSSSSVYGANTRVPYSVHDPVDHPVSLYAATKRAGELFLHSYSHLYGLAATCLRFFTVYGPWGRPDMALFKFVDAILHDRPIDIYNQGQMRRDFTYIDDVAGGIVRVLEAIPIAHFSQEDPLSDPSTSTAPWRIYNFGNGHPIELSQLVELVEQSLGKKAVKRFLPLQPGDMLETNSSPDELPALIGPLASTPIEEGVARFVQWYLDVYRKISIPPFER